MLCYSNGTDNNGTFLWEFFFQNLDVLDCRISQVLSTVSQWQSLVYCTDCPLLYSTMGWGSALQWLTADSLIIWKKVGKCNCFWLLWQIYRFCVATLDVFIHEVTVCLPCRVVTSAVHWCHGLFSAMIWLSGWTHGMLLQVRLFHALYCSIVQLSCYLVDFHTVLL